MRPDDDVDQNWRPEVFLAKFQFLYLTWLSKCAGAAIVSKHVQEIKLATTTFDFQTKVQEIRNISTQHQTNLLPNTNLRCSLIIRHYYYYWAVDEEKYYKFILPKPKTFLSQKHHTFSVGHRSAVVVDANAEIID